MNSGTVKRQRYLEQFWQYVDQPVIKVITGLRRSGKSVLLRQIAAELNAKGTPQNRIVLISFESLENAHLATQQHLYQYLLEQARSASGRLYVLLDEVQLVEGWQRVVNSLRLDVDCDIYVTGSNAALLSGDLATLIAGRYVQIQVAPLSLSEFLDFASAKGRIEPGKTPLDSVDGVQFANYLRVGGMPGAQEWPPDSPAVGSYLRDVFNSVVLKDVVEAHWIRNAELLERLVAFLIAHLGDTFSAKRIVDFLKSQGRRVGVETIYSYLSALEDAYVISKVGRYDIKGKRILETQEKYYLADHGFANALLGFRPNELPGLLENIVFAELRLRGYQVKIGKQGTREIDFIARRQSERLYLQVAYRLATPEVVEREFTPLAQVLDNHRKVVVSLDPEDVYNRDGVERWPLPKFLLDPGW